IDVKLRTSTVWICGSCKTNVSDVVVKIRVYLKGDSCRRAALPPSRAIPSSVSRIRVSSLNYKAAYYSVPDQIVVKARFRKHHEIRDCFRSRLGEELYLHSPHARYNLTVNKFRASRFVHCKRD